MKTTIVESTLVSVLATAGATFTAHEQVAVGCLAAGGAGLGSIFGTLLSGIFTGPGLEKLSQARRLLANWTLGFAASFVSCWWVRDNWIPSYPTEVVAGGIGFLLSSCGVCVIALLWPIAYLTIRNIGYRYGAKAATKQINSTAPTDSPDGNSERSGRSVEGGPPTVYLGKREPRD